MYVCLSVCMYVCVFMYVCMFVCLYVYIYTPEVIKVGYFTVPYNGGQILHMKVYLHSHYDAPNYVQDLIGEINFKCGNVANSNGNSWYSYYGGTNLDIKPQWYVSNNNGKFIYTLYITLNSYSNSSFYEVSYSTDSLNSWTNAPSDYGSTYSANPTDIASYQNNINLAVLKNSKCNTLNTNDYSLSLANTTYVQNNISALSSTYQPIGSYLTTSAASATYQPIGSYLTTSNASSTYLTIANAAATYQTIADVNSITFYNSTYASNDGGGRYLIKEPFNKKYLITGNIQQITLQSELYYGSSGMEIVILTNLTFYNTNNILFGNIQLNNGTTVTQIPLSKMQLFGFYIILVNFISFEEKITKVFNNTDFFCFFVFTLSLFRLADLTLQRVGIEPMTFLMPPHHTQPLNQTPN